jgi:hypothetical protein
MMRLIGLLLQHDYKRVHGYKVLLLLHPQRSEKIPIVQQEEEANFTMGLPFSSGVALAKVAAITRKMPLWDSGITANFESPNHIIFFNAHV